MRYRRLDANGDMTFGQSQGNFWINQPEGVAQLVLTRLRLNLGEFFYDTSDGTAWNTEVLGERTASTRDLVVRQRVQDTTDVVSIDQYGSVMDPNTRTWTAAMILTTAYGPVALIAPKLPGSVPPLPPQPAIGVQMAATGLGIVGGTPVSDVPADLTKGPRTDIEQFTVQTITAGSW